MLEFAEVQNARRFLAAGRRRLRARRGCVMGHVGRIVRMVVFGLIVDRDHRREETRIVGNAAGGDGINVRN